MASFRQLIVDKGNEIRVAYIDRSTIQNCTYMQSGGNDAGLKRYRESKDSRYRITLRCRDRGFQGLIEFMNM